mgnify:CR=1 FL=1
MVVQENISLKSLNTFGIDVSAKYFANFSSVNELHELLEFNQPQTTNHKPQTLNLRQDPINDLLMASKKPFIKAWLSTPTSF